MVSPHPASEHQGPACTYAKARPLTNFKQRLPEAQVQLAQEILKDPYHFDFLGRAQCGVGERRPGSMSNPRQRSNRAPLPSTSSPTCALNEDAKGSTGSAEYDPCPAHRFPVPVQLFADDPACRESERRSQAQRRALPS